MSDEHGWAAFGDDATHDDPATPEFAGIPAEFEHPSAADDDLPLPDDTGLDSGDVAGSYPADPAPVWEATDLTTGDAAEHLSIPAAEHLLGPVGADPDAIGEADAAGVFPPLVDVGALPEPVDGFPWIDTGTLGVADPIPPVAAPVTAADLAAYAAQDLPPAADPWAALADAEDPATSALARWWHPEA